MNKQTMKKVGMVGGWVATIAAAVIGTFAATTTNMSQNISLVINGTEVTLNTDEVEAKVESLSAELESARSELDAANKSYDALKDQYDALQEQRGGAPADTTEQQAQEKPLSEGGYLTKLMQPYDTHDYLDFSAGDPLEMGGKQYRDGFALGFNGWASYNLEGMYTRIDGVMGQMSHDADYEVVIKGDDTILETYYLNTGDLPTEFSLDVTGVHKLSFEITGNGMFMAIGFGELVLS